MNWIELGSFYDNYKLYFLSQDLSRMLYEYVDTKLNSIFGYTDHLQKEKQGISIQRGIIKIIWNRNVHPIDIEIDGIKLVISPNQMISCTYFHQVAFPPARSGAFCHFFPTGNFIVFRNHDSEVSCNGILFFWHPGYSDH